MGSDTVIMALIRETTYAELALFITAIAGFVSGILSYWQAKRTANKTEFLDNSRIELDREKNIWQQYEAFVDDLQNEVQRLRDALAAERKEIDRLSNQLEKMAKERQEWIAKVDQLQRTVDDLRAKLREKYGQ